MDMIRHALILGLFLLISSCSINRGESDVCFVGDSIFAVWDIESSFPDYIIHKHAVVGAKLEDLDEWNLTDCRDLPTVFLIGTNNVGKNYSDSANAFQSQKKFAKALLDRAQKLNASPLLYVSILPRKEKGWADTTINVYIESLNSLVKESLDSAKIDYRYVDSYSSFLNQGYQIKETLFKDGLHPNAEGYEVLRAKIGRFL